MEYAENYFAKPKVLIDMDEYDYLQQTVEDLRDEVWLLQQRVKELENGKV